MPNLRFKGSVWFFFGIATPLTCILMCSLCLFWCNGIVCKTFLNQNSFQMKILFSLISLSLITLSYKLLHNSQINVLIALIQVYRDSLLDLPGPKCKNLA
jgi:hypothetical protein